MPQVAKAVGMGRTGWLVLHTWLDVHAIPQVWTNAAATAGCHINGITRLPCAW